MRLAHLQCDDGITAELFIASLVDAGASVEAMQEAVEAAGVPARLVAAPVTVREIRVTGLTVEEDADPSGRVETLEQMDERIDGSGLPPRATRRARSVVHALFRAEAAVHGLPPEDVRLHELGRPRALARIVAAVTGLESLAIDHLSVSEVALGGGVIDIAHGRFPVPAPVTSQLLHGFTVRGDERRAELTTPSGAALLAGIARPSTIVPSMRLDRQGRGGLLEATGDRLLTVLVGSRTEDEAAGRGGDGGSDRAA